MPSASVPISNSAGEQIMPSESWPRIFRRPICRPPGMVVPTVASGTRSPTAMLKAPQQTCRNSPSPASTSTS